MNEEAQSKPEKLTDYTTSRLVTVLSAVSGQPTAKLCVRFPYAATLCVILVRL